MLYLGASLVSLSGYGTEPALIVPEATVEAPADTKRGISGYYASYSAMNPAARYGYLQWLATGRQAPDADAGFVFLFFYGLERRLLTPFLRDGQKASKVEPPLTPAEAATLRGEVARLMQSYDSSSFRHYASSLLQFLTIKDLLDSPDATLLPDPLPLATMPRREHAELPPLLALSLSRMASLNLPLSADWAWVWFVHDAESNLRTAAVRCPDELRRLFGSRYPELAGRKGILLRHVKARVRISYGLANPGGSYLRIRLEDGIDADEALHQVGRSPLKRIRELADSCMVALDAYSRRVGRDAELRNALPLVALLPDPLFADHPTVEKFRDYLNALVPSEVGKVATLPIATLLARWRAGDAVSEAAELPPPFSRGETLTLLDAIDRLGFVLEPDLRAGGAALAAGKDGDAVAAIARGEEGASSIPADVVLTTVALPLLVRTARAAGAATTDALMPLALTLPRVQAHDRARLAARLTWLTANAKESARLPRPKEPALADITLEERAQIADTLAIAASLTGPTSPAAVAELIRLFALLGLPDSEVFARLHASAASAQGVGGAKRGVGRRGATPSADEPLATLQTGRAGASYALPKPPTSATKASGVSLDRELVRQKEAESAQISSLLADIFADDEPVVSPIVAAPTVAADTAPPPGSLSPRHAALLRALLTRDSWAKSEVATLARAENLLPNAAIEAINEAAFEKFDEPVLEGEETIYVAIALAQELL